MESKIKPAAISDRPRNLDNTKAYRITLSLNIAIKNKDMSNKDKL
jgi:hypothetical protein